MLAQIPVGCCRLRFKMLAKDLLCRPRLAGNLRESQEKRLCQPPAAHAVDANRLLFRGPLENHRVQVLNPPRQFRPAAQKLIELLPFFVQGCCPLKGESLASFLKLLLDSRTQRSP